MNRPAIHLRPDTERKLSILSNDSRFDLACACGTGRQDARRRTTDHRWLYPVTLPDGGRTLLLRTLLSNACSGDCGYCPVRSGRDVRRCSLEPEEVVRAFMGYYRKGRATGLFLSSGVTGTADRTMEQLIRTARLLRRKEGFRGYLHLKIIPGACDAAIEESLSLASVVSLNMEAPGHERFSEICRGKDYDRDILRPLRLISRLTARGSRYSNVRQTTQFVVGAGRETDRELVRTMGKLYGTLGLDRVYFNAYQRGVGVPELPGERSPVSSADLLNREHRLYQTDFLLRKYGFESTEIPFGDGGGLSLTQDPKEVWAERHPECFPLNPNRAGRDEMLRVPGLGPVTVKRIMQYRCRNRLRSLSAVMPPGVRRTRAAGFLYFD